VGRGTEALVLAVGFSVPDWIIADHDDDRPASLRRAPSARCPSPSGARRTRHVTKLPRSGFVHRLTCRLLPPEVLLMLIEALTAPRRSAPA